MWLGAGDKKDLEKKKSQSKTFLAFYHGRKILLNGFIFYSVVFFFFFLGCHKERKEETFQKYRAEIVLLLALVVFYLTLIIFTCKFAQQQSIFPDFSKPGTQRAFLPVISPEKHVEPETLHKTELV